MPSISNLSITDLDEAALAAKSMYDKFEKQYQEEVHGPDIVLKNSIAFQSMPEETRQAWKNQDPESYSAAEKLYGGKNGRS